MDIHDAPVIDRYAVLSLVCKRLGVPQERFFDELRGGNHPQGDAIVLARRVVAQIYHRYHSMSTTQIAKWLGFSDGAVYTWIDPASAVDTSAFRTISEGSLIAEIVAHPKVSSPEYAGDWGGQNKNQQP
jgi:hypothetical protein